MIFCVTSTKPFLWGNDSLEDIKSVLKGEDLLDETLYADLVARTSKAASQNL